MQTPDTRPGAYYVTVVDGLKYGVLLGPFINDHAGALAKVDEVRKKAEELDPRAAFYSFGTARWKTDDLPKGKLNHLFGMPA
jgi:hypothetical protein